MGGSDVSDGWKQARLLETAPSLGERWGGASLGWERDWCVHLSILHRKILIHIPLFAEVNTFKVV